jgi:UPF0755 protein
MTMPSPSEPIQFSPQSRETQPPRNFRFRILIGTLFCFTTYVLYTTLQSWFFVPAPLFPAASAIIIEPGMSAQEVTEQFALQGFVVSDLALYLSLLWWHDPSAIKAGTYQFNTPLSAPQLAKELMNGQVEHDLLRLTLREGERATQFATVAEQVLPNFDREAFIRLAESSEGRLFPETYLVPDSYGASELFTLLTTTFTEKLEPLRTTVEAHPLLTTDEIITLASIIEREANSEESMKMVSGILQNRLAIGMALQVDASMEYVLDKPLSELTPLDLDIDSPYNTYLYNGLPPTPIGNPGLVAINAVINPTPSDYFYYITGTDGNFYYAETFAEHRENIARHLR